MAKKKENQYSNIFKYTIAFIYISSAILKLIDFEATVLIVQNLIHFEETFIKVSLFLLIIIEASLAVSLILNSFVELTKGLLLVLSISFILFNIVLVIKGVDNCGCFGAIKQSPYVSLVKNIAIIIMVYKIGWNTRSV